MILASIIWLIILIILIVAVLSNYRKLINIVRNRQRLIAEIDRIPGPHAIPLLGCTYQFKWNSLEFTHQMEEWGHMYAPNGIVRVWIGPIPIVILCRPESVKAILDSNTLITKANQYDILMPWLGTGLLTSTGDKWRTRRKLLTPTFHFSILNSFMSTFNRESEIFINQISTHANTNQWFDMYPYLKRCALDIICYTSMGTSIHAQTNHQSDYVRAVQEITELIWHHERLPWLWFKPIWYASGNGYKYDRCLHLLTDFTRKVIRERQRSNVQSVIDTDETTNGTKQRLAFLDLLLQMQKESRLTDEDIREEVDTFMFEGHDTTSSSMGWTVWLLGHHPTVQDRIVDELYSIFGDDVDRSITVDDLTQMKYLERCIKESLRLFPPVPLFARLLSEDMQVDGYTIPKGVTVVVSPLVVQRDPDIYPNPEDFDPDNFLPDRVAGRNPYAFIPFSAGPRNCIGQKFALMEEKTILAWLLRRYRIETKDSIENNRPLPEVILKPSAGFKVKIFENK